MSTDASTELIWVDCPDCGNASRSARRRCKAKGGMCKGLGLVQKWVPVQSATTQSAAPTAGTEIDIDWEALAKAAYVERYGKHHDDLFARDLWGKDACGKQARAVVAAYQQQVRDQGLVAVRASDVRTATNWYTPILDCGQEDVRERLRAALVAAPGSED